jgi:hypothetical protein
LSHAIAEQKSILLSAMAIRRICLPLKHINITFLKILILGSCLIPKSLSGATNARISDRMKHKKEKEFEFTFASSVDQSVELS